MKRIPVTPTFQSARVAGWKTGATKLHGFMAPMRVHCWRSWLPMNRGVDYIIRMRAAYGDLPAPRLVAIHRSQGVN